MDTIIIEMVNWTGWKWMFRFTHIFEENDDSWLPIIYCWNIFLILQMTLFQFQYEQIWAIKFEEKKMKQTYRKNQFMAIRLILFQRVLFGGLKRKKTMKRTPNAWINKKKIFKSLWQQCWCDIFDSWHFNVPLIYNACYPLISTA